MPVTAEAPLRSPSVLTWNLGDLFEGVVDAIGDRPAIVSDEVRLSFSQVDERANRLAHVLADAGVGPGDHVGLVLRNSHQYLEAMLAAFKLRAVPVNVNIRYTPDEVAYLLASSSPPVVICEADRTDRVHAALDPTRATPTILVRGEHYEDRKSVV